MHIDTRIMRTGTYTKYAGRNATRRNETQRSFSQPGEDSFSHFFDTQAHFEEFVSPAFDEAWFVWFDMALDPTGT